MIGLICHIIFWTIIIMLIKFNNQSDYYDYTYPYYTEHQAEQKAEQLFQKWDIYEY
jgi:hypothetical protein